jgi:hypothetical protein
MKIIIETESAEEASRLLAAYLGNPIIPVSVAAALPIAATIPAVTDIPKEEADLEEDEPDTRKKPGRKKIINRAQPEPVVKEEESIPEKDEETEFFEDTSEAADEADESPAAPALTADIDGARTALANLNSLKGLVYARKALQQFNCARVSDLVDEQFAPFIAHCEELGYA